MSNIKKFSEFVNESTEALINVPGGFDKEGKLLKEEYGEGKYLGNLDFVVYLVRDILSKKNPSKEFGEFLIDIFEEINDETSPEITNKILNQSIKSLNKI
jgi:sulfatase maturation enzyme AslB (radical SAM superfamily)